MLKNSKLQNLFSKHFSGELQAVEFINDLLEIAVQYGASDVHIEPMEKHTRIRLRIDGFLCTAVELSRYHHNSLISRIKIISGLDIAEKRLPQDGRVQVDVSGRKIDLRISTMPVIEGEKLVIRILDKNKQLLSLDALNFTETNHEAYQRLISSTHGIILLTGPTGSGKTTTLYATLQQLNNEEQNIITIEDPIEYTLEGINQIAVNNKAGLSFAYALRSILRQDPNIIMLGEIRDAETARIAVQAALTGHLVLSTLHTNNALGAVTRLLDIGIEPYLLASALRGVVAQRLVRTICPQCKEQYLANELEITALKSEKMGRLWLYKGYGCEHCNFTGYKGRIAVQEVLTLTPSLQNLISKGCEEANLLTQAKDEGFIRLYDDCVQKVLAGLTTVDELLRVACG